jgi:hypothetical protein
MLGYKVGSLASQSVRTLYPSEEAYERVGQELYLAVA